MCHQRTLNIYYCGCARVFSRFYSDRDLNMSDRERSTNYWIFTYLSSTTLQVSRHLSSVRFSYNRNNCANCTIYIYIYICGMAYLYNYLQNFYTNPLISEISTRFGCVLRLHDSRFAKISGERSPASRGREFRSRFRTMDHAATGFQVRNERTKLLN